jgi:anti-sigma B factor antagonist
VVEGSRRGLQVHDRGGTSPRTFVVVGELDAHQAPQLEADLLQRIDEGERQLAVHVAGVTFIDSTGLRALLAAEERCRAEGGWLRLDELSPAVQTVLEVTDLEDRFQPDA